MYVFLGDPEGAVSAPEGSLGIQSDGGPGYQLWQKQSGGDGPTGWAIITPLVVGQVEVEDGTLGAPSISFVDDPDTGIYRAVSGGSVLLSFVIGGTAVMQVWKGDVNEVILSGVGLGVGEGDVGAPGYHFTGVATSGMYVETDPATLDTCFARLGVLKLRLGNTLATLGTAAANVDLHVTGSYIQLGGGESRLFIPQSNTLALRVTTVEVLRCDLDATAGYTRLQIHDNNAGGLRRVKAGANGTGPGGVGRALYLDNV